jgi:glucan phosphoethanolaminetransferase (alkaline phosphatase superfamily)
MVFSQKQISRGISLWQIFRIVFVIFFLYLLGDVFYRWDGFKYHSSFSEFLPSVALVSILWSIMAVLLTMLLWLLHRGVTWFSKQRDWKVKQEQLLLFIVITIFLSFTVWFGKSIFYHYKTSLQLKFVAVLCVISTAIFFTWLLRRSKLIDRIVKLLEIIQQHITPLVWIFGFFVFIAVPIVAYHTWFNSKDKVVLQEVINHSSTNKDRPNIILVTYDALTARHMSVYGYKRETTPFISKWSQKASLFTMLHAASNWTGPTCSSLMTGKRVWTHQKYDPHIYGSPPIKSETENLALELKKRVTILWRSYKMELAQWRH